MSTTLSGAARAATLLAFVFLLACGGAAPPPPEPTPEPTPEETPCCSIDDVVAMSEAGVDDELIIASIAKSEVEVEVGAQELIRLNEAGVSKPVQQALMGEDPEEIAKEAEEAKVAEAKAKEEAAKPKGPPPLNLAVAYSPGAKAFTLTNTGGKTYTGLVMTANGQYVYALPIPLPPGNPDRIKLGSMTSTKTGHKLHPNEGLQRLYIKSDQGSWSKRF